MIFSSALLLLTAAASCGVFCVEVTQPPSMVVKTQESFSMSCTISVSIYCIHWIRQPAGKGLEWLGYLCSGGTTNIKDSVKNKISFTQDTSKNTVFLQGRNFQTEDTAVYYCARFYMVGGYFDYWGKGTQVTVSSAQPSAPQSIFGLSQCGSDSDGFLTIGCMARGFSPADSLTFKWTDPTGQPVNDFVQYPAFGRDGDYIKVSHLRVKERDSDANKRYKCEAENSEGKKETNPAPPLPKPKPKPTQTQEGTPTLTLKTPIQRELFLSNTVILQAVVTGNEHEAVKNALVSCSLENKPINAVSDPVQKENSLMRILNVTVDTQKWFDGKKVTCTISNSKQEIQFDKGDAKKPNVVIYEQSTDNKDPKHVSLVCEVTSPQLGDVYIMWTVDGGKYKEAPTSAPIRREDFTSVLSILKVSAEDYKKSVISCAVKHANMENTSSPLIKSAGKNKPPEPEMGFALHCNEDVLEEDEFRSLWSTATSFIFLFLFSLTYSALLSLTKMKQ